MSTGDNPFSPSDIIISIDLIPAARFLLDFLAEISTKPELHEGPLVECAIQRYERYWLPLVAKHPGRLLPAPLDIEWVWHCHMLAPEAYNTDCQRIAGKLIDHHLLDKSKRKELIKDSERLWRTEYADVPFSACDEVTPWFDNDFVSALTYNLSSAVARQKIFNYQVSLPHYRDAKFLKNALLRYKKFLYLKCHNPHLFLIPCFDNDLIWHSHLMFPVFYKDDLEAYLGTLLPHDDSINDRTPGTKLSLLEVKTRNLWKKVFNEKLSCFGAMFRGLPPNSKLHPMTKEDVYRVATKQVNVLVEKVRVSGLPQGKAFKLKLCYNTGYQNFNRSLFVTENIATVKGNSRTLEDQSINTEFSFDTRYNDKVIASLQKRSGRLCLGTSDILGEGKLDLQKKIHPLNSRGLTANDDIDCGDGLGVGLVWSCPAPTLGPCVFRLEPGEYQACIMPQDREALWGPINLPRLPQGMDNHCSVASHKLFNHMRRIIFTVRMIHSEPMLMSAIHVFFGDKLTSLAHLIVGDHLPLPSSVSEPKRCVTLNPKEGQRAVLIKNNNGDWGIAVGWWEGFQRRGSGRKGSCSEGHLEVRFFHLPTHKWHYVSFDRLYSLATSKFQIGDCVVEFDSGFIEIDSKNFEIGENLALIFSVALIHVLCQPRPQNWTPGLSSPVPVEGESSVGARLNGSEEITLLLAAGVLIATPCNHAIKNLFKKKKKTLAEGSMFKKSKKKEEPEQEGASAQNGGPSVILHEAEVNAAWGGDATTSHKKLSKIAAMAMGTRLMSISESNGGENSEEEEEYALKRQRHDTELEDDVFAADEENGKDEEQKEKGKKKALAVALTVEEDEKRVAKESVKEEVEDEEDEKEEDGMGEDGKEGDNDTGEDVVEIGAGGVFEVEDFNISSDSQAGLFGNGESDSDEVQVDDDEEDMTGFAQQDSEGEEEKEKEEEDEKDEEEQGEEEEEVERENHHEEDQEELFNGLTNGVDEDYPEEDGENFYDEFYNIDDGPTDGLRDGGTWDNFDAGDQPGNSSFSDDHLGHNGYAEEDNHSYMFGGGDRDSHISDKGSCGKDEDFNHRDMICMEDGPHHSSMNGSIGEEGLNGNEMGMSELAGLQGGDAAY